jgi:hypothetical protein
MTVTDWSCDKAGRIAHAPSDSKWVSRRRARPITVVAFLVCLASAEHIAAEQVGGAKRVIHFSITEADIAQVQRGEADGHQPWRSDPCMVAQVALLSIEPEIDPRTSLPCTRHILSPNFEKFTFELKQYRHIDQISVRRLYWRDPQTGKTALTVWWATEAVVSEWPKPAGE